MAYADFTLESAEQRLGLTTGIGDLFPGLTPLPVPEWLKEIHRRGRMSAAMVSEKARSEFIVAPILLACRELVSGELAIFSGQRLDVDPSRGLVGECDYILARTVAVPRLRAPLLTTSLPGGSRPSSPPLHHAARTLHTRVPWRARRTA